MPTNSARLIIQQWIQEVWNRGNISLMNELCSEDYTLLTLGLSDETAENIETTKAWIEELRWAFPDLHMSICSEVAEKNRIALHNTARGTFAKNLCGVSANHKPFSWHSIMIIHVNHMRIHRMWITPDRETLLWWLRTGDQAKRQ